MICQKFAELTVVEKIKFIGELTHACMSDNEMHEKALFLINSARNKGLFDNVKIMPPKNDENTKNGNTEK